MIPSDCKLKSAVKRKKFRRDINIAAKLQVILAVFTCLQ